MPHAVPSTSDKERQTHDNVCKCGGTSEKELLIHFGGNQSRKLGEQ